MFKNFRLLLKLLSKHRQMSEKETSTLFFYKDQRKKFEPGQWTEIATYKLTTVSLNFGHISGWCPYKLGPHKKKRVHFSHLAASICRAPLS